jgi:hypothetical protein
VAEVFKLVQNDNNLKRFYKNKNIATIINKYTYFIANQIGANFELIIKPNLYKIHEDVMQNISPIFSGDF